ncbi:MAG: phosphatidylserine decarboxylase, partial [Pseudomonadota bacterium]
MEKRIHNRLPFAWEGIPFMAVGLCFTILCLALGLRLAALFLGLLTLFIIYFFRDPEREAGIPENAVLAPADGKIIGIRKLTGEKNPLGDS